MVQRMEGDVTTRASSTGPRGFVAALVALVASAGALSAQDADFLFGQPKVSVGLHVGYAGASAGSEIFDWTRSELTVGRRDFNSGLLGVELAFRATERLDLALGVEVASSETRSEYRNWVGNDDLPIVQTTSFTRTPLTAGLRYYLLDRGRSIGRFAWVPGGWSPYVGVGAGWTWYRFEQSGEWIDFESDPDAFDIFRGTVRSDGFAPTAQVLAGVQKSLSPRFFLSGEGRYSWASSEMDRDFQGFDAIDLGGFQFVVGISARF
jgi:opacity protein-like surface antigen